MKQVSVTFSLPKDVDSLVKKDAKKGGFSRSDWIRGAIYDKLHAIKKFSGNTEPPY